MPVSFINSTEHTVVNVVHRAGTERAVHAYAAHGPRQALEPWTYHAGPLGASEVDIAVTHCGVCHTDVHLIDNDFGISRYPLVPGHEVIGRVSAVGAAAGSLAVGQRVGVGWQRGACNQCEWCKQGLQNLCAGSRPTPLAGHGGFADSLRVDHRFAIPIPDSLDSSLAAPLLCGGITVYAPLSRLVQPACRVGIIGIGGLGHLAVQFARAMGAEVFAFSTTGGKEEEARRLGAHHFVAGSGPAQMERLAGTLDVVLATANANLDWSAWFRTLRPNGKFCLVGDAPGPITLPVMPMLFRQLSFEGSLSGAPKKIGEMLQFAALHGIRPAVEVVSMRQANLALEKVRLNQARYRMVLAS